VERKARRGAEPGSDPASAPEGAGLRSGGARQQTIAEKVSCRGVGLHTGVPVELSLHPARPEDGIVFLRRDLAGAPLVPARPASVTSTSHATSLAAPSRPDVRVSTVEHLLAALWALGVDNARVELDGPEVPALDGSAAGFVELVRTAGAFEQSAGRAPMRIRRPVEVEDAGRRIRIEPCDRLRVSYAVEFDHPAIGRQELYLPSVDADVFVRELAAARTFGFLQEVSALIRSGLARGGSLENTLVLDDEAVLNTGGLRWADEFVRHKALDLLGDLALLGVPLLGHVSVERGGHQLHQLLLRRLLEDREAWELEGDPAAAPSALTRR